MALQDQTTAQIDALVNTRHPLTGMLFPARGTSPSFYEVMRMFYELAESSFGALQVKNDDAAAMTVLVNAADKIVLDGGEYDFAGDTEDLSGFNNDVAYVYAEISGGNLIISSASDATGWPVTPHIKLAEVTISSSVITDIEDRRFDLAMMDATQFVRFTSAITTQGDTGTPSVVTFTRRDLAGNIITGAFRLRVRVVDNGDYDAVTNAAIAAGTNATLIETLTAGEDLVFLSHTDGTLNVQLTDATAETVQLLIGPPPLLSERADYNVSQTVTHAAP